MIFILIALVVLLMALGFCAAEAWYERDWPRDMGKFSIYAFLVLILCASAFGQAARFATGISEEMRWSSSLVPGAEA